MCSYRKQNISRPGFKGVLLLTAEKPSPAHPPHPGPVHPIPGTGFLHPGCGRRPEASCRCAPLLRVPGAHSSALSLPPKRSVSLCSPCAGFPPVREMCLSDRLCVCGSIRRRHHRASPSHLFLAVLLQFEVADEGLFSQSHGAYVLTEVGT